MVTEKVTRKSLQPFLAALTSVKLVCIFFAEIKKHQHFVAKYSMQSS